MKNSLRNKNKNKIRNFEIYRFFYINKSEQY